MERREEGHRQGGANPGLPRKLRENGNTGRVVANIKTADAYESTVNMNKPSMCELPQFSECAR